MNNIQFTPHFELREFVVSHTARDHGLDNTPPAEAVENLRALCVHTLEPLREALGLPIVITSGYRTRELNRLLVCHSNKSQHMSGEAADFYISSADYRFQVPGFKFQVSSGAPEVLGDLEHETGDSPVKLETPRQRLIRAFRQIITDDSIAFDQCIIYPSFIHVSYVRSGRKNRSKLTRAFSNGSYAALTRAQALALL